MELCGSTLLSARWGAAALLFIPQRIHNILLWARCSRVYRLISLHNISRPVFVSASFGNQWSQRVNTPKTITIVAGEGSNHRFAPVCVTVPEFVGLCSSLCVGRASASGFVSLSKTHICTFLEATCWKSPRPIWMAALFLLLKTNSIVLSVCPCCRRKPSVTHPVASICHKWQKFP